MQNVCVACKAHLGWVNAVAVAMQTSEPAPLLAQRIELVNRGDREAIEPYHIAGGWDGLTRVPPPADPAAVVRRGKRKQVTAAKRALATFRKQLLTQGFDWRRAVMLTTRGIQTRKLSHSLDSHAHIHVAEGAAMRNAMRRAVTALDIELALQDEKSTLEVCMAQFTHDDLDVYMKPLKPAEAHAWSKEERLLAWAAWLHLA